tara:strand:- start:193 stop:783 length:591 start_codon:yes stop_codon:yes gene_type:complete
MAILFDDILSKGVRSGQMPAREQKARDWYRDTAGAYRRVNENQLMRGDTERLTARPLVGQMYLFNYDAKHKATLPYFDRFPLVFPFKTVKGGFYGINLHYLPLQYRAKLMDSLYDATNNNRYDETTRLRISYDILSQASRFRYFKPCVKRYLTSQLRSRFLYIYPAEWDIALFLPLERFQGAGKATVFKDSRQALR